MPDAQHNLGIMYAVGQGTSKNIIVAHMWLEMACTYADFTSREDALKNRDAVAASMTQSQLSESREQVRLQTMRTALLEYGAAYQIGDLVKCEALARSLIQHYPDASSGYVGLARILLRTGRALEAVEILSGVASLFEQDMNLQYQLGLAHFNAQQILKAEPYLRKALVLKPDWAQARYLLGHCLYKGGRNAESLEHLKFAAEALPRDPRSASLYGSALFNAERLEEAKRELSRAIALDPRDALTRQMLHELESLDAKKVSAIRRAKWPPSVAEFSDLRRIVKKHVVNGYDSQGFVLEPGMSVLTQGSCFARNLAIGFGRYPLNVSNIPLGEEHNSTFANAIVLRWLLEGVSDDETRIAGANIGESKREEYLQSIKTADLYVFTLGVAPVFFDRKTGKFQMPSATTTSAFHLARNCAFRTTTVSENLDNLSYIVDAVKSVNPKAKIVITVSPVPLNTTLEMPSAVIADCVSKSTLRVVAHELTEMYKSQVLYWPSFEIVRWLSAHHGIVFGGDDGSSFHVNREVIETIIDSFVDVFGSPQLKPN